MSDVRPEAPTDIRLRAMLTGMLLCGVISVGLPYGECIILGTRLGLSSSTPAAFFLLFVLIVLVQPLLGSVRRTWLFSRKELLVITVMMMLATAIPTRGFTGVLLPMISGVFYYATPENNWAEQVIPHIPTWLIPQDLAAVKGFWEGLPQGHPVPWAAWFEPLGWWLLLMAAFYTVVVCLMVIMRRQWMDHERLLYPLTQVPLGMVEDAEPPALFKPFLKNSVMWIGFAVPFLLHSLNSLSHYYEFVPRYDMVHRMEVYPNMYPFYFRFDCMWTGLAYFINTGVSFSLWFFYLLAKTQEAICARLGVYNPETLDLFSHTGPTMGMLTHQSTGAMLALVGMGLWTARTHLREVWRQVWRRGEQTDADELISYRTAVVGVAVGVGIMAVWLWCSGIPVWAVAIFLCASFAIFLALTRVIVEAGLASAVQAMSPAGFLISGVGSSALGTTGIIATGFTLVWSADLLVFMMAPCANGIRMLHGLRQSKKRIVAMIGAALAISLLGSLYAILKLAYTYGAINFDHDIPFYTHYAQEPFRLASYLINTPSGPNRVGWIWNGVGASLMALLILGRQKLVWWPLHPIGLVVSGTHLLNSVWSSIFIAWLVKVLILKYIGARGYLAMRWFFLGMILGQFTVGGFWLVVDGITGMTGNRIRMY